MKKCYIDILRIMFGRIRTAILVGMVLAVSGAVLSCDDDDDGQFAMFPLNRPNAVVTVKPSGGGSAFYMQLDDSTRITATNMVAAPYGAKEVRAFVNYRMLAQPCKSHAFQVYVNWIDSIRTKPMAECLGSEANGSRYGEDPVELLRDWTVSEDGYLTVHFRTQWAPTDVPHIVNLAQSDPSKPYDVTFYHNAQGVKGGYWGDGIVAFRLDCLPDTKGKTVDMTLRWQSFSGSRSVTFKYSTRKGTGSIEGLSFAQSGQFEKAVR